jgi:hypothetical protein
VITLLLLLTAAAAAALLLLLLPDAALLATVFAIGVILALLVAYGLGANVRFRPTGLEVVGGVLLLAQQTVDLKSHLFRLPIWLLHHQKSPWLLHHHYLLAKPIQSVSWRVCSTRLRFARLWLS